MSKKDSQSVIIEPNIFAANYPNNGMGRVRNNAPAQSPSASSVAPALDPSSYTFTAEQLGLYDEPKKAVPAGSTREFAGTLLDNSPADDAQGTTAMRPSKIGGKLGDFFRGLAGRVKPWGGSDASRGDGGTIGYLGSLYTSPAEEAEYRRRSQNKMKLMALADAVRQFGNIYHTSRSAPAQQFDNIYEKERARYLQDKAMRDRDNQYYIQQKAREAQLDMQRERMAAEAARLAEELAMKKEINDLRKPIYENQAKEAGYKAEMKEKEAANYDNYLKNKNDLDAAKVGATKARESASLASAERARVAAMNDTRRTNSTIAKNARTGGGGGYSGGGSWTSHRDGSSWRGTPQKGDIKIQEYKNKDQWVISKDDWKHNYARINEILEQNPNSAAAKALKNAKNETERMAIAQRYATSTKESYDYMRALSKGHIPGNKAYASTESKQTGNGSKAGKGGKRTVNMNEQRNAAVNKLKGASV